MNNGLVIAGGRLTGRRYATDRTLMSYAAQAAGAEWLDFDDMPYGWCIADDNGEWRLWSPLDSDDDATRLADSLGAVVTDEGTYTAARIDDQLCVERHYADSAAARRRAIVGIAAMQTIKQQGDPANEL